MRLTVNGRPREVAAGASLPALLDELAIDRRVIAVALNGEVLPRDQYDATILREGDRVEVVRMVGGG
jgi:thiamine biosynthesis protein ThiS